MNKKLKPSNQIWAAPIILTITIGAVAFLSGIATSTSANTASYQTFTQQPDLRTQQALLGDFRQQKVDPVADMPTDFREMILKGHPLAMEVAFEALTFADGADAAVIYELLGNSISANPEDFMTLLATHLPDIDRLDALLGNLGEEFTDDLPTSTRVLEDRYFALRNVSVEEHSEAREQALLALSKMIFHNREMMVQIGPGETSP